MPTKRKADEAFASLKNENNNAYKKSYETISRLTKKARSSDEMEIDTDNKENSLNSSTQLNEPPKLQQLSRRKKLNLMHVDSGDGAPRTLQFEPLQQASASSTSPASSTQNINASGSRSVNTFFSYAQTTTVTSVTTTTSTTTNTHQHISMATSDLVSAFKSFKL